MSSSAIFDAIIIGSGPAGLSTALGLGRIGRSCVVLSNSQAVKYRNSGIEASHAVLGHDHVSPEEINALGRKQIARYKNTTFVDDAEIMSVDKKENMTEFAGEKAGFVASDRIGRTWIGKTVVLATGVKDLMPEDLEGYRENWAHNIYQCLFCDGFERRTQPRGMLCYPDFKPKSAKLSSSLLHLDPENTSRVTLFTNGKPDMEDPAIADALKQCRANGLVIETRKVMKLVDAVPKKGLYVHLKNEDGTEDAVFQGFLAHKPPTTPNAKHLIEQLGIDVVPGLFGENIKTEMPFQSTKVAGVYAVGDAGVTLTHVTNALLTGISAAAGVSSFLNEWDDEVALQAFENGMTDNKNGVKVSQNHINGTACVK